MSAGVGCVGCRAAHSDPLLSALGESPLFCGLPDTALRDLLGAFRHETWRARSPAMTPTHTAERFYVVVAGRLKICRINPDTGREVGLLLLGPGDAFDVLRLLDGEPLAGSTQALDDLEVVSTPLRRVCAWREEHPEFDRALRPYLAQQLRSLADLASELALYDTNVRLARLILRHVAPDRSETAPRPIDDLSHETLASLIGSVRVVVNRHIQELKRDGVISARRGHLAVEDLGSLVRRSRNRSAPCGLPERRPLQPESQTSLELE
jgi:CRP-like cAMP-binding protein